jgi:hypothetical protein
MNETRAKGSYWAKIKVLAELNSVQQPSFSGLTKKLPYPNAKQCLEKVTEMALLVMAKY